MDCCIKTFHDTSQECPKKLPRPSASRMAVTKQCLYRRPQLTCEEQCRRPDDLLLHDNACLVLLAWVLISSCGSTAACSTGHAACLHNFGLPGIGSGSIVCSDMKASAQASGALLCRHIHAAPGQVRAGNLCTCLQTHMINHGLVILSCF